MGKISRRSTGTLLSSFTGLWMCPAQHRRQGTVVVNTLPVVWHDSFSSKQTQNSIGETNHQTVANEASETLQLQRGVVYHPPCAGLPRAKQENSSPFTGMLPSAHCNQGAKSFHSKGRWSLANTISFSSPEFTYWCLLLIACQSFPPRSCTARIPY